MAFQITCNLVAWESIRPEVEEKLENVCNGVQNTMLNGILSVMRREYDQLQTLTFSTVLRPHLRMLVSGPILAVSGHG